jgi:hypothetical protein
MTIVLWSGNIKELLWRYRVTLENNIKYISKKLVPKVETTFKELRTGTTTGSFNTILNLPSGYIKYGEGIS